MICSKTGKEKRIIIDYIYKKWISTSKGKVSLESPKSPETTKIIKSKEEGSIKDYFDGPVLRDGVMGKNISFGGITGVAVGINRKKDILQVECSRSKDKKKFSISFIYKKYAKQV